MENNPLLKTTPDNAAFGDDGPIDGNAAFGDDGPISDDTWGGSGPIGDDDPLAALSASLSMVGTSPGVAGGVDPLAALSASLSAAGTSAPPPPPAVVTPQPPVSAPAFAPLTPNGAHGNEAGIDLLLDVTLQVSVELGRTKMKISEILEMRSGSVLELDKLAGEPADILVNGTLIARGEVVVVDEKFGVRVVEVVPRQKRILSLG